MESVYISGHSAPSSSKQDHIVYIYGGYQQPSSEITTKIEPSSNLFVVNIQSNTVLMKVASDDFATAGNSLLFVDNDCLLINGGTQKAMSLFTRKSLIPDKCGLGEACTIDENFVSPIPWIFCDGKCQRWLHMHCIALKVVPKGNFYCDQCCKSKKVAKRKGAEQEKSNKPTKKRAPSKKQSKINRK